MMKLDIGHISAQARPDTHKWRLQPVNDQLSLINGPQLANHVQTKRHDSYERMSTGGRARFCLCVCISIMWFVTFIFIIVELRNTRDEIQPFLRAATPLMADSRGVTAHMNSMSESALHVMQNMNNASEQVIPFLDTLMYMLNASTSAINNVEKLSRHPTMHITASVDDH